MPASPAAPPPRGVARFKLAPSDLTFLWDDCKRCFYLKVRRRIRRPRMPFPSVFSTYHELLQGYAEGQCPSALTGALPPGEVESGERWVQSAPLTVPDRPERFFIRGRVDQLACFRDGTYGLIDYKTTDRSAANADKYARQLHAYAWALERPVCPAERCAPVSRMGLLCLHPAEVKALHADDELVARLRPRWVEIERDDDAFAAFLAKALAVLAREEAPPPAEECSCCQYHRRMQRFSSKQRT